MIREHRGRDLKDGGFYIECGTHKLLYLSKTSEGGWQREYPDGTKIADDETTTMLVDEVNYDILKGLDIDRKFVQSKLIELLRHHRPNQVNLSEQK